MIEETARLTQQFREGLDEPERARQWMADLMMQVYEGNKALLQRFNALEAMQVLAAQLNERGFVAEAKELPRPQPQPEDTWGGYLYMDELQYRVWVEWGIKDEHERHVYQVVGYSDNFNGIETVSFGNPKDGTGDGPFSASDLTLEKFAHTLIINFMRGTKAKEVF